MCLSLKNTYQNGKSEGHYVEIYTYWGQLIELLNRYSQRKNESSRGRQKNEGNQIAGNDREGVKTYSINRYLKV